ncbi:MAG: septum formation initiator family protein [Woeseia sp.]
MVLLREIRKRARHVAGPVLGACVFSYFAYHAVQGDRGLIAWLQLDQQVEEATATLAAMTEKRQILERRTSLLRPDNLDPDMLEERARATLGFAHPDEVVIFDPPSPAAGRSAPSRFPVTPSPRW